MGKAGTRAQWRIMVVTQGRLALLDAVADDVFDNPVDMARARACLRSPDYRLLVAVAEGVVIGQIRGFLQHQPDDAPWLYIDNLGVAEAWKRQGVATALLDRLADWSVRKGAGLVWLGSVPDNEEATGFYAARGFTSEPMMVWSRALDED
jgi:aminoglycoside 6'-N-acetyltransferase I